MRVVTDTNVLFAAFVSTEGTCAQMFEVLLEGHTLVLSSHILGELREHLTGKRRLDSVLVDEQIAFLESSAVLVSPADVPADTISDPDDLPVLGTAIAGRRLPGDRRQGTAESRDVPFDCHPFTTCVLRSSAG